MLKSTSPPKITVPAQRSTHSAKQNRPQATGMKRAKHNAPLYGSTSISKRVKPFVVQPRRPVDESLTQLALLRDQEDSAENLCPAARCSHTLCHRGRACTNVEHWHRHKAPKTGAEKRLAEKAKLPTQAKDQKGSASKPEPIPIYYRRCSATSMAECTSEEDCHYHTEASRLGTHLIITPRKHTAVKQEDTSVSTSSPGKSDRVEPNSGGGEIKESEPPQCVDPILSSCEDDESEYESDSTVDGLNDDDDHDSPFLDSEEEDDFKHSSSDDLLPPLELGTPSGSDSGSSATVLGPVHGSCSSLEHLTISSSDDVLTTPSPASSGSSTPSSVDAKPKDDPVVNKALKSAGPLVTTQVWSQVTNVAVYSTVQLRTRKGLPSLKKFFYGLVSTHRSVHLANKQGPCTKREITHLEGAIKDELEPWEWPFREKPKPVCAETVLGDRNTDAPTHLAGYHSCVHADIYSDYVCAVKTDPAYAGIKVIDLKGQPVAGGLDRIKYLGSQMPTTRATLTAAAAVGKFAEAENRILMSMLHAYQQKLYDDSISNNCQVDPNRSIPFRNTGLLSATSANSGPFARGL
jgi:hypothetical protein